jgi:hypothetical protein
LVDAFHVPKLLSQQFLPFGRSDDGLGVLTFGVEQFSVLFVPRGRSVRAWRTVRAQCSSCVLRVLAHLRFRSVVALSFRWTRFRTVRVCRADSPRVPGGQSACSPQTVRFSGFATGGFVGFNGRSAALGQTVRGTGADSPRYPAGQSARPVRTVRPTWPDSPPVPGCFALWFDSFIPSFVIPRVLQGIVPKT